MPISIQVRMIGWTAAVALSLGALTVFSLLEPPKSLEMEAGHALGAPSLAAAEPSGERSPASLAEGGSGQKSDAQTQSQTQLQVQIQQQAIDLTLECEEKSKDGKGVIKNKEPNKVDSTLPATIKQVRLTGRPCGARQDIASTEIRNEANGYSATVFFPQPTTFTTDYISLAKGPNRIRILHVFKRGGREERDYMIERQ